MRKGGITKQCCSRHHAWTRSAEASATARAPSTSSLAALTNKNENSQHCPINTINQSSMRTTTSTVIAATPSSQRGRKRTQEDASRSFQVRQSTSIIGCVRWSVGRSVGRVTNSFDNPLGAPYWAAWPCFIGAQYRASP